MVGSTSIDKRSWSKVAKKDLLTQQIFVCLYLCGGDCAKDPSCPWIHTH